VTPALGCTGEVGLDQLRYSSFEKRKGEIKRAPDELFRAFFNGCSEGGFDEDGDGGGGSEAMASDACRNSSRYHHRRRKNSVGQSTRRAAKEYLDEG